MSFLDSGDRTLTISDTKFIVVGISGREGLSEIFSYELDLVSDNTSIDPKDYIGKEISFKIEDRSFKGRFFHGLVKQLQKGPVLRTGNRRYRMTIVPNLWLLQQSSACRIYQEKTVKQILEDVLTDCPLSISFQFSLTGSYAERDYCVQYQETDFNFVSRLMEEEGLFYFFEHKAEGHTMHICDSQYAYIQAQTMVGGDGKLQHYYEDHYGGQIKNWTEISSFYTGQWELESYDFETVSLLNAAVKGNKIGGVHNDVIKYDYLSRTKDKTQIDHFSKVRMETDEIANQFTSAQSDYPFLQSGGEFELGSHGDTSLVGKKYVITALSFNYTEEEYDTGASSACTFHNEFSCMPSNLAYRPQSNSTKPRINGLLTAKVTSDTKDGPVVDQYGRIKIQMNWEFGKNRKKVADSCWVRVAQMNAGTGWGSFFLPDKDQEVLVSFIDGDPDCPIVTGSVYNGQNKPPFAEKDKGATQFGIKTSNGNEFSLQNKKDKEEIYFKAKRDMRMEIDNDETSTIKQNKTLEIQEGNFSETIKKGKRTEVLEEGDKESTIKKGNEKITLDSGNVDLTLSKGDYTAKVSAGSTKFESGKEIELKVGTNSIKMDSKGITLKTPAGSLTLDSKGAVLKGLQVEIKGDTTFKAEGGVSAEVKGGVQAKLEGSTMVEVKGSAMASISGGIAKIN